MIFLLDRYVSDGYNQLTETIRQSDYYSQVPSLLIECADLDGTYDSIPIIFEDIYSHSQGISKDRQHPSILGKPTDMMEPSMNKTNTTTTTTSPPHIVNSKSFPSAKILKQQQKKQIEIKKSKEVLKKLRKNHDIIASENNPIQLIGYRKMNDDLPENSTDQFTDTAKTSEFAKTFRSTFTASLPSNYTKNKNLAESTRHSQKHNQNSKYFLNFEKENKCTSTL